MGRISDERFATMSMSLENEQSGLKDSIPEMESCLENAKIQTEGLQRFIDKAKRVTQLTELTPELVHALSGRGNLLQRRWNYPRAISRRNGRILPRAFETKSRQSGKNGIAVGLYRFKHNNILFEIQSLGAPSLRRVPQAGIFSYQKDQAASSAASCSSFSNAPKSDTFPRQ